MDVFDRAAVNSSVTALSANLMAQIMLVVK